MTRFLLRRALRTIVVLWGVSSIVFVVLRLSGDPVALLLPPDAPRSEILRLRKALGLDTPLWLQYVRFLARIAHADFGESLRSHEPAMHLIMGRIGPSLELAVVSIILAVTIAVPVGILSATRPNSFQDLAAMVFALLGQSTPTFLLGIILILIFSVQLRILPTGGYGSWTQLILPTITLAAWAVASIARLTRSVLLETLHEDYIRTARAKGLAERVVLLRHALRNALIPILNIIGINFGALLGGAFVVETIFSWPGIGRLIVQSVYNRDYPVVQAGVFVIAVGFVLVNTVVDVLSGILDPRIRQA